MKETNIWAGVEAGGGLVLSVGSQCRRLVEWPGPAVALVRQVPRNMPMGIFPRATSLHLFRA
jgi:hypothetical protein